MRSSAPSTTSSADTRFGQIKRGEVFLVKGTRWVRTRHGACAKRELDLSEPGGEWPFQVSTIVQHLRSDDKPNVICSYMS